MAQDKKQNKITYMILSVIIAIAAWALVAFANNPDITKTVHNVNMVLKGEEELKEKGLIAINPSRHPELSVKLNGKRSDIIDAIDKITVEVNLSEITDTGEYNLKGSVVLPNSRIIVDKTYFSTIPITVDVYESAEIPVKIVQHGNIDGKIVKSDFESETVTISGAKSEIDRVAYAVAQLDIQTLEGDGATECVLLLKDKNGEDIINLHTVENPMGTVYNVIYDYKELPVRPILHETLKPMYQINYDTVKTEPETVGVGVMPDTEIDELTVIIHETSGEEEEYKIEPVEGVYIPQGSESVRIKLELEAAIQTETTIEEPRE